MEMDIEIQIQTQTQIQIQIDTDTDTESEFLRGKDLIKEMAEHTLRGYLSVRSIHSTPIL